MADLRIGVVAGEASGDWLGAGLLKAMKARMPDIAFEGIGGPEMQAQGCRSLFPLERLSVLGVTEVAGRYWDLRRIRRRLIAHFLSNPPAAFVGIDSAGFNLGLEQRLRRAGIPTLHYVSPQVWAWRRYRMRKIRKAVDHMLTLFPFEEKFYQDYAVPATFVGHPLADHIPDTVDQALYRATLKLPADTSIVALLPGSRVSELKAHADLFIQTALWLHRRHPQWHFVAPFVNRQTLKLFEDAIQRHKAWDLPLTKMFGHSRDAMAAADIVLLASGTATLEAALLKRMMIVTYKVSPLSYALIKLLSRVRFYSMPNHLAGHELVPELMQGDAVPEKLGTAVEYYLSTPARTKLVYKEFQVIHEKLRRNANERAAEVIFSVLSARHGGH